MKLYKNILSYLLLSLYVISGAHGAVSHCHDADHRHLDHSHGHEGHNHGNEDISFLHSITHEIIHSVAHLIEHTSHDHDCCDVAIIIKVDTNKNVNSSLDCFVNNTKNQSKPHLKQKRCQFQYSTFYYKEILLSYSSLRGPPSIV